MKQFGMITLSSSLVLLQLLLSASAAKDHTCYPYKDYQADNECQTIGDGVCDDPEFGGSGGDACRNQDCIDCNVECRAYDADCYGCVNAEGCYYCPGDGTCENSPDYISNNKVAVCEDDSDFLSGKLGHTTDNCIAPTAFYKDPLYEGSKWMFEMTGVLDVWETYGLTGKGVTVRINDDGVYVNNKEFDGRFDDVGNSCAQYLPNDEDGHGTYVAGIILGNANNDLCAVGIAPEAKFSSCNFFADNVPYSALAYKLETFDISQNSVGMPACLEGGQVTSQGNVIYETGCPFTFDSDYKPCDACDGQFRATDRSLSSTCTSAIANHCKYFYKDDADACLDFPEVVVGGDCDYDKLPSSALSALEQGITSGRNGKGTIFTFASGNSFDNGDDVNFSGWTNSRYTISVGAVGKDGQHADYSSPGAALLVSAPAGDNKDIGHLMTAGLGSDMCSDSGQGTSFACPVVSGVIALMLEANPELSWRDVQGIIAKHSTTVPGDAEDDTQTINGAGIWHSNWYGFGIINAKRAVEAAMNWNLYTEELQAIGISKDEDKEISDNDGNQFTSTITLSASDDNYPEDFVAESTVVLIDLSHYNRGDLEIELESPSGTKSILHPGKRPENNQLKEDERWKLMTVKNWGEDPTGTWKLTLRDLVDREDSLDKNVFRNWQIVVYGRSVSGQSGFDDVSDNNDSGSTQSEFCLDPTVPKQCDFVDGMDVCPAETIITGADEKAWTIDAKIVCNNDLLISQSIDWIEASQRGLCGCQAGLFDDNCDVVEEDLQCQCFICPEGSAIEVSYTCQKDIVPGCKSFDCAGTCNGEYKLPGTGDDTLMNNQPPTKDPTPSPTKTPTKKPTLSPTSKLTKEPTVSPTKKPTEEPTVSPTKKPTKVPTNFPTPREDATSEKEQVDPPTPTLAPTKKDENVADLIDEEDLTDQVKDKDETNDEETPESQEDIEEKGDFTCDNAIPISSTAPPVEGTIQSLPVAGLEGPCLSGLETVGGWYKVVGNGNVFTLTACSLKPSKNVGVGIFTGSCSESKCIEHQSRQIAACETGNGHSTSFTTQPDKVYNILVSGIPLGAPITGDSDDSSSSEKEIRRNLESESDFVLELTETEMPPNSKCAEAFPASWNKSTKGSTLGLLTEFKTCQDTVKSGSWYTIEGDTPKNEFDVIVYSANTCNQESNFYNTMSVYRGDSCSGHECVDVDILPCPSGWFGEQVFWSSGVKENYQIFVHSSDVVDAETFSAGNFQLDLQLHSRLGNDQCNAAKYVELNREEAVKSTTMGAKPDIDSIFNSSCGTGGAGGWFKVRGTGGVLQASTCSGETNHKTSIQIYSGQCDFLECVDFAGGNKAICDDGKGSAVNFKTEVDVDYYILVTSRREGQSGAFRLEVTEQESASNNDCTKADALPKGKSLDGSTLQATIDFPPEASCVVPLDTPGVWYTIKGANKGIEVNTCQNNEFDSAISIFQGSCNSLECVAGSSAVDSKCTDGKGVATTFYGEKGKEYHVYVHGASRSGNHMGEFTLSYSEFEVKNDNKNEFCTMAHDVNKKTDGRRIEGSTEDSSHASVPVSSCGVEITNPGQWYTFRGNGQPFDIEACSEDEGDFDVSVSIFEGGPAGCDELTCLAGTTFSGSCSSLKDGRFLQQATSPSLRFMSAPQTNYYIFVHGTGVGDFAMYVRDENVNGFGTESPTVTPVKYGKDLYRWIPVNSETLVIPLIGLDLEFVREPTEGNATIGKDHIKYTPPLDFTGDVVMTLDGCSDEECSRFNININVMGEKIDPAAAAGGGGRNKLWLLLLLLLLIIPLICLPFYMFYKNRNKDKNNEDDEDEFSDRYEDDPYDRGLLPSGPSSGRGRADSSGDDWESSDDDDDGSFDSNDQESGSDDDDDDSRSDGDSSVDDSNDGFASGFSSDGFRDELSRDSDDGRGRRRYDP